MADRALFEWSKIIVEVVVVVVVVTAGPERVPRTDSGSRESARGGDLLEWSDVDSRSCMEQCCSCCFPNPRVAVAVPVAVAVALLLQLPPSPWPRAAAISTTTGGE
mmetsp:Transcript_63465/g.133785  ORF Transcript_63465/g.133785 Transcript_63465/m.133785 type:complete len:106 (+) Transcript_63465:324-641(+)